MKCLYKNSIYITATSKRPIPFSVCQDNSYSKLLCCLSVLMFNLVTVVGWLVKLQNFGPIDPYVSNVKPAHKNKTKHYQPDKQTVTKLFY